MPRSSKPTISAILNAGFQLFFQRGFARVSMDDIASSAGVTKRTLYYHFPSKDSLVGAVLEEQNEQSLKTLRKWKAPEAKSPEAFVASLFDQLLVWSKTSGWSGSGFTRLSMELGDLPGHPARRASKKHKAAVENWICEELQNRGSTRADVAASQVVIALEGAVTLTFIHDDPKYLILGSEIAKHCILQESDLDT